MKAARSGPGRPQLDLFAAEEGEPQPPLPARAATKPPASAARDAAPAVAASAAPAALPTRAGQPKAKRVTAESLASKQREISVSEFFVKNRHLLGFDNPSKALLTTIKEAV
ncbi:MAG TPA: DNA topoisomerase VI subunit B, partial [Vicinamibacteria bacterium]